jgi:hypothetical protein
MLNHFNSISKGSFKAGENRFIFQQVGSPEIAEQLDQRNAELNTSLADLENNLNRLKDEDTNISFEITDEGNIFEQIQEGLSETYNETEAASVAAEIADALSDNSEFISTFGEQTLSHPNQSFTTIKIQNGELILEGDTNFRVALNEEFQSDHLTELIEARDSAVADAGAEAGRALDDQLGEFLGDDELYRGRTDQLDGDETAREFVEELDNQALFQIQYIADTISDSSIDTTDAVDINNFIGNWLSSGDPSIENYARSIPREDLDAIFAEAAEFRGETTQQALGEFAEDTAVDIDAAEGVRGAAIQVALDDATEAATAAATDSEAAEVLQAAVASTGENPPEATDTEALRAFLTENLPQFALEGIQNFYRSVVRTLSIIDNNQRQQADNLTATLTRIEQESDQDTSILNRSINNSLHIVAENINGILSNTVTREAFFTYIELLENRTNHTIIRENITDNLADFILQLNTALRSANSEVASNFYRQVQGLERNLNARNSASIERSIHGGEQATVEMLSRQGAIDTDSQILRQELPQQIRENRNNAEGFNSYELPADFQGANYNENRFRLLLTSGRIANADQIYLNMEMLDLSSDDLARALNFGTVVGRRNGRKLERIDLLRNTQYSGETMEQFLTTLAELQEEGGQEYLDRLTAYRTMNSLVSQLEGLTLQNDYSQIDISPDNIQDVELSRDAIRELRDAGLRDRPRAGEQTLLMAFYVHLYGPLERLIAEEHIQIEQRSDFNVRRQNQYRININSIPEEHREELASMYNQFSGLARNSEGQMENYRSLTQALSEIRQSDRYQEIREISYQEAVENLEALGEDATEEQRIFALLHRIFDVNYTGPYYRNGRRSVTMFDIVGDGVRGNHETDNTAAQLGDLSMFNYLVNTFVDYSEGPAQFNYTNLETELNHLIANGRSVASIQAYTMQRDNPEQYEALRSAANVTVADLESGQITEEQIMAIRQGILFEASLVEARHETEGNIEDTPESNGFITEIASHLAQQGMPEEDLQRISASIFQIMMAGDFTDGQGASDWHRRLNTHADNPDFGALANLNFYVYQDENGERQVAWGEADENGDVNRYFTASPGVGNMLQVSNVVLDPRRVAEVLSLNMAYGRRGFGSNERGQFEAGAGLTGANAEIYVTIGGEVGARRRWRMDATVGGATTYNLMPVPYIGLSAERTMGGRIERQINRSIDDNELLTNTFTQADIESIARGGRLSPERLEQIADNSEYFTETIAELNAQNEFTEEQLRAVKRDLVQTLVNALVNEGVENLGAFAFKGLSITYIPPSILIPSINFSILGKNKTYYSAEHTTADVESYSEAQILAALDISNPQPESETYFVLPTESVDIVVDADGNRTLSRITEVYAENGDGERLEDDFESLMANSQEQRFLDALNTRMGTTGLSFEQLPDNHEQSSEFSFAFRIGDYASDLSQYGVTRQTEILASRYSGITIEPFGDNLYGIRFGNNPDDLPAEPVIMARQDITSPYGLQPTRTIISFNTGEYTPASEIRQNPFLREVLSVDSRGNATYRPNIYFMEMEGIPEFTVDNVRDQSELNLLRPVSDAEYAESQALFNTLTLDGISETRYDSASFTQEQLDYFNEILEDEEFLQRIRVATSIDLGINLETSEGTIDRMPDYNELATIIREKYPEVNDNGITYIISRLTTGTLMRVNDVPTARRIEYTNRTTELTTAIVTVMARELGMDEPEGTAERIANTIQDLNLINEVDDAEIVAALMQDEVGIEPFPGSDGDIAREITANNTWTAVGSSEIIGLRHTIFDFAAEQALPEGQRSPQIVNSSLRRLDMQDPAHLEVAEFLHKLYEPQVDPAQVEAIFQSGVTAENFGPLGTVLQSNAALQLLSLNMNERDGNTMSVVSYYLNQDGDPSNTRFLNELYTYVRETNAGRPADIPEMTPERQRVLQTFVEWTMQILNASPSETTSDITDPNTGEVLFTVNSNIEAGTFLIKECANLSFYFDREIDAELRFERPADFATGASEADTIYAGAGPQTVRSEGELGLAAMVDVNREPPPPPDDVPPEEEIPPKPNETGETDDAPRVEAIDSTTGETINVIDESDTDYTSTTGF